jgi:hypothetical protein
MLRNGILETKGNDGSTTVKDPDPRTITQYDCRCDERLKPKDDESTCLAYTDWVYY